MNWLRTWRTFNRLGRATILRRNLPWLGLCQVKLKVGEETLGEIVVRNNWIERL